MYKKLGILLFASVNIFVPHQFVFFNQHKLVQHKLAGHIQQHRERLENIERHIEQTDYKQELRKCKQHRADEQVGIGLVRFENVIAQRQSAKENRKNPLEQEQPKTILLFFIGQRNHKKIDEQKRQTTDQQRKNPGNADQFDDKVNHQDPVRRKEKRPGDDVIEIFRNKQHVGNPGEQ